MQKLFDFVIRKFYSFKKKSCCEIIVILSINAILISVLLVFLVVYREHFDLNNPIDYINALLDCYSIFEIYTYVGFFIFQLIVDYRRRIKPGLAKRYNNYSKAKIINKTEHYYYKIRNIYEVLNKAVSNSKNKSSTYYAHLEKYLNKVKIKLETYETKGKSLQKNTNNNPLIDNTNVRFDTNECNPIENNIIGELNNKPSYSSENVKKENENQKEEQKEELKLELKEEEKDPEICIRKYKKVLEELKS